jgi:hypothetical protein
VGAPFRQAAPDMAERDLTAREDRFIGLCLVELAIIIVFLFIVTTS